MLEPAGTSPIRDGRQVMGGLAFLLIGGGFYIFTYNSGYGYDACEYLLIGRGLLDGFRLSDFVLSKGWATYTMAAGVLALIPRPDHAWISLVITLLFALAVGGTWWAGRRLFGNGVAAISALLVAVCAFFMELNFLEPEIPVYLAGLLAVYILECGRPSRSASRCFAAGLSLGAGFAFKAVAGFYLAAVAGHLLLSENRFTARERLRGVLWIASGFALAVAIPAAYFAATGQLRHHVLWSFLFPFLYYPANTVWLRKLYTKLLWFFILLFIASLVASTTALRHTILSNPRVNLVLWMGGVSLLSLLKTQSSHYVFPGAAFLSFFIAQTLYCWWTRKPTRPAFPAWIPAAAAALLLISAWLYSPAVFARLFHKRDVRAEEQIAARLQTLARPGDRVLFLEGGMSLYWLAKRYPVVPFMHTDVQATYLLFQRPDILAAALDDPRLTLVEFDPQHPQFDDPHFFETEHHRTLIALFSKRLAERFTPLRDPALPLNLWTRKPGVANSVPVLVSAKP